ncbi:MAG: hydroxyethylthiazole kinase [Alistipes sp.]|jgi:hydroxyethylthiazole kinase|nr:hydroxyethylthiazole kinase [Alistipes sp.]
MKDKLWDHIARVRALSPLVHNVTNFVAMNNTANAVLAVGASPVMSHARSEVEAMVGICGAVVVNIGTLDEYWAGTMLRAAGEAGRLGRPWVFDPVGAGATPYRDGVSAELLALRPTVIRGNASEIMALTRTNTTVTKGVDSTAASTEATEAARRLSRDFGSVVCVSGGTDVIVAGELTVSVHNGSTLMTRVTGLGCSASAVIGAFVATGGDTLETVTAATALFAVCGEIAAEGVSGPGSLQAGLLDKLHNITATEFADRLRIA